MYPRFVHCLLLIGICVSTCCQLKAADREPVRWPDWAKRTYAGIQDARDQQSHELKVLVKDAIRLYDPDKEDAEDALAQYDWLTVKPSNYEPLSGRANLDDESKRKIELYDRFQSWKERTPLFQLDTEVDMLASALLALERPDVVIDLYQRWYDEDAVQNCLEKLEPAKLDPLPTTADNFQGATTRTQLEAQRPASGSEDLWNEFYTRKSEPTFKHFRTPAAILFYSRAHRDRALKTLETPGLQKDRLTAFEEANKDMAKAFYPTFRTSQNQYPGI